MSTRRERPAAIIIAGPNGAGKTTFARHVLQSQYPGYLFLNVDEIQREHASFAHPMQGGREFLRRLARAEAERQSFALETMLASTMYARRLRDWNAVGYRTMIHFIEVPSADFAVNRVRKRVTAGGHPVPEADIRRRFHRGLPLFESVYKTLVGQWYHWLSDHEGLQLVDVHKHEERGG